MRKLRQHVPCKTYNVRKCRKQICLKHDRIIACNTIVMHMILKPGTYHVLCRDAIKEGGKERQKKMENLVERYGTNTNESGSRRPPDHTTRSRKTIVLKLNVRCTVSSRRKYKLTLLSSVSSERKRNENHRSVPVTYIPSMLNVIIYYY
ncbi:uncharacterized protein LOC143144595 isoform X1 [Ptiloglossa arizonensis]|uniref:uncharacterized protein LOC143144595 isoform X1 n=1 Tax=Ptiloglossa arizonensis TaxID=3350558 RepID=UPI003FA0F80D